jgi:hypothetical protein
MRDLDVMRDENYGLLVYARGRTPYASEPWAEPAEENVQIQCGGVLVRPGDVLVGDGDGVVVVPSWFAEECVAAVEEHEAVEAFIKDKIERDNVPPGRYYHRRRSCMRNIGSRRVDEALSVSYEYNTSCVSLIRVTRAIIAALTPRPAFAQQKIDSHRTRRTGA